MEVKGWIDLVWVRFLLLVPALLGWHLLFWLMAHFTRKLKCTKIRFQTMTKTISMSIVISSWSDRIHSIGLWPLLGRR